MKFTIQKALLPVCLFFMTVTGATTAFAQFGVAVAPPPPGPGREEAPIDITGYWVSIVTEDWRFRMVTAPPGDSEGISLTPKGREVADAWDPEADAASGNACKAYGAGGIMRIPTRLHISWVDDNVLKIETDAGMQTRLLKFGVAQDNEGAGSRQGVTKARWILERQGRFGPVVWGSLEAETSDMAPGYLRRNGIPYGKQTHMTEYFELLTGPKNTQYMTIINILEDPENVIGQYITSTNFKREPDGSKWNPTECMTM